MTFGRKRQSQRRHLSDSELAAMEEEVFDATPDLIERIDRELGNPTGAKNADWAPGPVLLDPQPGASGDAVGSRREAINSLARHGLLGSGASEFVLGPGHTWPVFEPADVQFVTASASASSPNFHQVIRPPKPRVVLPDGVRV